MHVDYKKVESQQYIAVKLRYQNKQSGADLNWHGCFLIGHPQAFCRK